ncbi:hypothetical protein I6F11_29975 [Ensifer sp. NBAIM29]|nr:hypothetical protein [Ensifer sp. NBAIM29]
MINRLVRREDLAAAEASPLESAIVEQTLTQEGNICRDGKMGASLLHNEGKVAAHGSD